MFIRKSSLTLIAAGIVTATIASVVILTVRPDAEPISLVPQDKNKKWKAPYKLDPKTRRTTPKKGEKVCDSPPCGGGARTAPWVVVIESETVALDPKDKFKRKHIHTPTQWSVVCTGKGCDGLVTDDDPGKTKKRPRPPGGVKGPDGKTNHPGLGAHVPRKGCSTGSAEQFSVSPIVDPLIAAGSGPTWGQDLQADSQGNPKKENDREQEVLRQLQESVDDAKTCKGFTLGPDPSSSSTSGVFDDQDPTSSDDTLVPEPPTQEAPSSQDDGEDRQAAEDDQVDQSHEHFSQGGPPDDCMQCESDRRNDVLPFDGLGAELVEAASSSSLFSDLLDDLRTLLTRAIHNSLWKSSPHYRWLWTFVSSGACFFPADLDQPGHAGWAGSPEPNGDERDHDAGTKDRKTGHAGSDQRYSDWAADLYSSTWVSRPASAAPTHRRQRSPATAGFEDLHDRSDLAIAALSAQPSTTRVATARPATAAVTIQARPAAAATSTVSAPTAALSSLAPVAGPPAAAPLTPAGPKLAAAIAAKPSLPAALKLISPPAPKSSPPVAPNVPPAPAPELPKKPNLKGEPNFGHHGSR